MPLVFEAYLRKNYPRVFVEFEIRNTAIFKSDLSRYLCAPTESFNEVRRTLKPGSVVVVIGGEVLSAKSWTLYSHSFARHEFSFASKVFGKFGGAFARFAGMRLCGFDYEFPYIFRDETDQYSVCFNTIGGFVGDPGSFSFRQQELRLREAEYVSFRDRRNENSLDGSGFDYYVFPDSVSILPVIIDEINLEKILRPRIKALKEEDYFVFQAAPAKCRQSASEIAHSLDIAQRESGKRFYLLPIGYAAGHDDAILLEQVSRLSGIEILDDLNVWEIMSVIKESSGYFGTSLHGAITALVFQVPHFCIGEVSKLVQYLKEWSVEPYCLQYDVSDIPKLVAKIAGLTESRLEDISSNSVRGAITNFDQLLSASGIMKET